ncbi:MAG: ATP synthase F1 subunit delta [candidate division KSB1 bacterium]|nr:ATP synthase F1 subunit delta [candidate division KSB1 bacterium]
MIGTAGAKRYAAALFALAEEQQIVEQIYQDLHDWQRLLYEHGLLRAIFYSPQGDRGARQELIEELLRGKTSVLLIRFLQLLMEKNRQHLFDAATYEFDRLYRRWKNQLPVKVTTAFALNDEQQKRLKELLAAKWHKEILLEIRVDARLLGGLILEADGRRIDLSLRCRLEQLRRHLNANLLS